VRDVAFTVTLCQAAATAAEAKAPPPPASAPAGRPRSVHCTQSTCTRTPTTLSARYGLLRYVELLGAAPAPPGRASPAPALTNKARGPTASARCTATGVNGIGARFATHTSTASATSSPAPARVAREPLKASAAGGGGGGGGGCEGAGAPPGQPPHDVAALSTSSPSAMPLLQDAPAPAPAAASSAARAAPPAHAVAAHATSHSLQPALGAPPSAPRAPSPPTSVAPPPGAAALPHDATRATATSSYASSRLRSEGSRSSSAAEGEPVRVAVGVEAKDQGTLGVIDEEPEPRRGVGVGAPPLEEGAGEREGEGSLEGEGTGEVPSVPVPCALGDAVGEAEELPVPAAVREAGWEAPPAAVPLAAAEALREAPSEAAALPLPPPLADAGVPVGRGAEAVGGEEREGEREGAGEPLAVALREGEPDAEGDGLAAPLARGELEPLRVTIKEGVAPPPRASRERNRV
jgi:hypothetical protein